MGKIQSAFVSDFTVLHNNFQRDKRLGLDERGMLSFLLTLPDDWNFSIEGLTKVLPNGKTKIMTTLNKLKEFGYFRRRKIVDSTTGRIIDWEYDYSDEAHPEWIEKDGLCESVETSCSSESEALIKQIEKPHSDFPDVENETQSNTYKSNIYDDLIGDEQSTDVLEQSFVNIDKMVKGQIQYDKLCEKYDPMKVNRIKDIIIDVMMYRHNNILIGKENCETQNVQVLFGKLNYDHIDKICELIEGKNIHNFKAYIKKSLFNAANEEKLKKPVERKEYNFYEDDTLGLYAQACDYKFDNAEIRVIEEKVMKLIPYSTGIVCENDIDEERYEFVRTLYKRMMKACCKKDIHNKFAYFCTMLDNCNYYPRTNKKKALERTSSQPSYDLDAIFEHALSDSLVVNSRREE